VFTLDPTGERFAFARFRGGGGDEAAAADGGSGPKLKALAEFDQDATELADMQSNGAAAQRKDGDPAMEGGELHPTEDPVYSGSELKNDRNRISAWQAGWNVTNAIQVRKQFGTDVACTRNLAIANRPRVSCADSNNSEFPKKYVAFMEATSKPRHKYKFRWDSFSRGRNIWYARGGGRGDRYATTENREIYIPYMYSTTPMG